MKYRCGGNTAWNEICSYFFTTVTFHLLPSFPINEHCHVLNDQLLSYYNFALHSAGTRTCTAAYFSLHLLADKPRLPAPSVTQQTALSGVQWRAQKFTTDECHITSRPNKGLDLGCHGCSVCNDRQKYATFARHPNTHYLQRSNICKYVHQCSAQRSEQ
jgi:hypothetical protein